MGPELATGLRERKKLRTRQHIADTALRLFAERGLAATTVADIAAAADVSPRTFFTYFPTKEAAVFADHDTAFAAFGAALEEPRGPHRTAIDVLQEWVHSWMEDHPVDAEHERCVHALRTQEPTVAAFERALMARFEDAMTHALAEDLRLPDGDVRARMVSAAAVAAMRALEPEEGKASLTAADHRAQLAALDDALAFLQAGLGALRNRP